KNAVRTLCVCPGEHDLKCVAWKELRFFSRVFGMLSAEVIKGRDSTQTWLWSYHIYRRAFSRRNAHIQKDSSPRPRQSHKWKGCAESLCREPRRTPLDFLC
ncbi:unnamed protein product, partial [Ectocarpus sp. 12 AP-2014]